MSLYEIPPLSQFAVCTTMIQQIHLIYTISDNSSELNRTCSVIFSFTGSSMLKYLRSHTVTQYIILEWLKYFQALQRHILYPCRTRQMISNLCEPGFSRPDLQRVLCSGCDGLALMTVEIKTLSRSFIADMKFSERRAKEEGVVQAETFTHPFKLNSNCVPLALSLPHSDTLFPEATTVAPWRTHTCSPYTPNIWDQT